MDNATITNKELAAVLNYMAANAPATDHTYLKLAAERLNKIGDNQ
ncbi:hypothetical protein [Corynebacterium diphtheriae]|nr:hypothetical protein [Corynebacterium diphtheriae]AEX67299.1 hypothetical protein CDC7B_1103 [Corynebacterium diphtheriae C7 (beta)]CAB0507374.1 hypothetical protein CIP107506_01150 [Corynebacterium diphtheriae]CAB0551692.1 hypothetical protein CIP107527_01178 [Corynebacterium diphtheriae]CAB0551956.1 hypothetical protein CIP107509_01134 [Corynebacterium diphtheriae]CAB0577362.1 hypothetical protein CIP107532_02572 [Corynebacterium diphtheriae]